MNKEASPRSRARSNIFSYFVRQGIRGTGKPDKDHPDHYIGFKVETKKSGIYPTQVFVVVVVVEDEARGKTTGLTIKVEDRPSTKMRCTEHRKCFVAPKASPATYTAD